METLHKQGNYKHGYDIETNKGYIHVPANNRAQAADFARKAGYIVYSVNFTG